VPRPSVYDFAQQRQCVVAERRVLPLVIKESTCDDTQTMRILLSRGIAGIDERTRGITPRWLDMVDWRAANIRDASLSISRSLDPARAWVERQERAPTANMSLPAPTAHECANHLAQLATELRQEAVATAMDSNWRIADPSKYLQQVCRELARLLSRAEVRGESARLLAKHIGDRLPPGWGAVWIDKGCSALTGTSDEQLRKVVHFLQEMEIRCKRYLARQTGTCRLCHTGWCTRCPRAEAECEICSAPVVSMAAPGESDGERSTPTAHSRKKKREEDVGSVTCISWGRSLWNVY